MAHVKITTSAPGTFDRLREVLETMMAATGRYLAYRRSLRELSRLDDRILKDIGLSRSEIKSVARYMDR